MSQFSDSSYKTFEASGTIAENARVVIGTDGKISQAGINVVHDGFATRPAVAGDKIAIKLRNAPGTVLAIAVEAVEVGDLLYSAANGKVADTAAATSYQVGRCLSVGTADGHYVEVLPFVHGAAN